MPLCPVIFDGDVLAFDVASLAQPVNERRSVGSPFAARLPVGKPDYRPLGALSEEAKRPCCRRAAKHRDEGASFHRITSRQARRS
jgi:hypothetical protein